MSDKDRIISDGLYAGQFVFQWLSLLIFTLEYLSTEQEVRKVLGLEYTKKKRQKYAIITTTMLLASIVLTFYACRWTEETFYDSWISSLGECIVAGAILCAQITFIKQIAQLIEDSKLDLVPVKRTFCRNLSVVGFIFLVQCGDVGIHILKGIFLNKSVKE